MFSILAYEKDKTESYEFFSKARSLGNGPEIIIAEAFQVSAAGNFEEGLRILACLSTPIARSAAVFLVLHHKNASAALEWISTAKIQFSDFDDDGKFILMFMLLEEGHWERALTYSNSIQEEDFQQAPALVHATALAKIVQVAPVALRHSILYQIPFEAVSYPLASTEQALSLMREARQFFLRGSLVAKELHCIEAANTADDYALWIELRDPESRITGIHKLEENMRDSAHALRRLSLALQFGVKLNYEAIEQEIDRQIAISGGKSLVAVKAGFSLTLTRDNPQTIVTYIDRYRTQLHQCLGEKNITFCEIKMLSRLKLSLKADAKLNKLITNGLSEIEATELRMIIHNSEEIDPLEIRKEHYEKSGKLSDLSKIVELLYIQKKWQQLCHYSSLLFDITLDLSDAEIFARSLNESNRFSDLAQLLRKYPEFLDQSDYLQMLWSWMLYREGFLIESKTALEKLRVKRDDQNDRNLEVNIAISTGQWETLTPFIENEWANRHQRNTIELLHTARLALFINEPRAKELIFTAAQMGRNNPDILIGAYYLATRAGWDDEPEIFQWLQSAAELSDDYGPLKKISLKDFADWKPEWNRILADTWQKVYDGTFPIFGAAYSLNKSLVELFLLPAIANPFEQDPRRRALIPAFSAIRPPLPCDYRVVVMDATALLTLCLLSLLDTVSIVFEQIIIPHSTLRWLFEEKQQISFHQPSRIRDAEKISLMLAQGKLKEFKRSSVVNVDLVAEIGEDLASMITEAQIDSPDNKGQKIVIRSFPVHRVGSYLEEQSDLSSYCQFLCSCQAVCVKLRQKGQLTESEAIRACTYLNLCEKEWPNQPNINDGAQLFIDDLSVSYLLHTGLIEKLHNAGLEAFISTTKINETTGLLRSKHLISKVNDVIEDIRVFLANGIKIGKIMVDEIPSVDEADNQTLRYHPSFALFNCAKKVQAIIVDDRAMNQHWNLNDGSQNTPILTAIDFIDELKSRNLITLKQLFDYRTKLRQFSYLFVPITTDELEYYLNGTEINNGYLIETAELKAIRENILQIRMSHFLQLPKELNWLNRLIATFIFTLKAQWCPEINVTISIARSNWLLEFIDIRSWTHCQSAVSNFQIGNNYFYITIMPLLLVQSDIPEDTQDKYWKWLEDQVINKISQEEPEIFSLLIKKVKDFIAHAVDKNI